MRAFFAAFLALTSLAQPAPAGAAAPGELVIPPATYPNLARSAAAADGFVPAGWSLEKQQSGDLNGDGRPDLVLVLRETNPANIVANEGLGRRRLNTNPRILAVALADGGGYRLVTQNHTLIPRETDPVQVIDVDVTAADRAFKVKLRSMMTMGSWGAGGPTFTFRVRDNRVELIGYDSVEFTRNTGASREVSINYLSGRMKISSAPNNETAARSVWRPAPSTTVVTIDQIGNGLDFDGERRGQDRGAN